MKGIYFDAVGFDNICKSLCYLHRLFMGGFYPMGVESVRLIRSNKNFEEIMTALSCLDMMMSTEIYPGFWKKIKQKHVKIVKHLFSKSAAENQFDEYIYETFECFIRSKQQIIVNVPDLNLEEVNDEMRKLMMHRIEPDEKAKSGRNGYGPRRGEDMTNLIKKEFLNTFKYVKKIQFNICDHYNLYRIGLGSLLKIMNGTQIQEVILQVGKTEMDHFASSKVYPNNSTPS